MSIGLYMDVHVPRAITRELRARGADVITAQDDGSETAPDDVLLARANGMGRAVFTQDRDFLRLAASQQVEGVSFAGVIYARQMGVSASACIDALTVIALAGEPADLANKVEYIGRGR